MSLALLALMGAGDESARFNDLGHRLMCVCGCNQILLECNHVGCSYSEGMRSELGLAVGRGENDDLTLQSFVQKYGPTVIAAPTNTGFNRVAWVMPYFVLGIGIASMVVLARAWKARAGKARTSNISPNHGDSVSVTDLDRFRREANRETAL
ncbi:MAG: cytochrome c-type biogenesis protein CcmH [Acidobacteriales bacterium]|nr:cytochrome c-type biogenesis protein CcmH [Terriglobales bacterium]